MQRKKIQEAMKNVYFQKMTANGYHEIEEQIARYRSRTYPAIIPIPSSNGSTGYGIENIKKDVEKAVGTDILFKD